MFIAMYNGQWHLAITCAGGLAIFYLIPVTLWALWIAIWAPVYSLKDWRETPWGARLFLLTISIVLVTGAGLLIYCILGLVLVII